MLYLKAVLRYLIKKINLLERKANFEYSTNPFGSAYNNTIIWIDENKKLK